jgi:hypothetical protein
MVLFDICDEMVTKYAIKHPEFYAKAVKSYEKVVKKATENPVNFMISYHVLKQQIGHTNQQKIKIYNKHKNLVSTGTSSLPAKKFMLRQRLANQVANPVANQAVV